MTSPLPLPFPASSTPRGVDAVVRDVPVGDASMGDTPTGERLSRRQRRHLLWGLLLAVALIAVAGWSIVTSTHLPVSPPTSVVHDDTPEASAPRLPHEAPPAAPRSR